MYSSSQASPGKEKRRVGLLHATNETPFRPIIPSQPFFAPRYFSRVRERGSRKEHALVSWLPPPRGPIRYPDRRFFLRALFIAHQSVPPWSPTIFPAGVAAQAAIPSFPPRKRTIRSSKRDMISMPRINLLINQLATTLFSSLNMLLFIESYAIVLQQVSCTTSSALRAA